VPAFHQPVQGKRWDDLVAGLYCDWSSYGQPICTEMLVSDLVKLRHQALNNTDLLLSLEAGYTSPNRGLQDVSGVEYFSTPSFKASTSLY
jgi:hypothetical protein